MKKAFRLAFPHTLPVMAGYLFLGMGFGVLLSQAGYGAGWALVMSGSIYAGAMQYVAVELLVSQAGLWQVAVMTLMVNARHLFYGLAMAPRYRNTGKIRSYLAFSLTDETFAVLSLLQVPEGVSQGWFYFAISVLHQLYWIAGSLLGAVLGAALPVDYSGIEFSMTALFVVMLVEQSRQKVNRLPLLLGLGIAFVCLLLLGPEHFTLPAMLLLTGVLYLCKGKLGTREASA